MKVGKKKKKLWRKKGRWGRETKQRRNGREKGNV